MQNRSLVNVIVAALGCLFFIGLTRLDAQELYVYSEPASVMPARSLIIKQSFLQMGGSEFLKNYYTKQNFNTQLEFSIQKKWMAHIGTNYKSVDFYTQYRFYSSDALHEHARFAGYLKAVASGNNPAEQAILLDGQQKLIGAGIIATKLKHKWASSVTLGWLYRYTGNTNYSKNAFQYSWSNGLLLYPVTYKNYKQTNINFYVEMLGQQSIQNKAHFLDIAPAVQFIFNSQAKLNFGYRLPVLDNMQRNASRSYYMSLDYLFFNALPRFKSAKK